MAPDAAVHRGASGHRLEGGRRMLGHPPRRTAGRPLVTIITVVLDQAAALERSIRSVLAQTYPSIEFIVIDGGSRDGTLDVIRRFGADIDYYLSEPDNGEYDATNKAIVLSSGDYICLLNAADTYHPEAMERMVERASELPGAIVYTDYDYGGTAIEAPERLTPAFNLYNMQVAHQSLMVPRALHMGELGLYRTDFRIVSDYVWMRDAYRAGVPFRRVPRRLLYFDDTGISSGQTAAARALFETEVAARIRMFYPFVPDDVARHIYRFIHAGQSLTAIRPWVAAMQQSPPVPSAGWLEFEESLAACLGRILRQRGRLDGSEVAGDRGLLALLDRSAGP